MNMMPIDPEMKRRIKWSDKQRKRQNYGPSPLEKCIEILKQGVQMSGSKRRKG